MEFNFDKIKPFTAITILMIICGVIIPGFLFLFIYNKELFFNLDYFRLTVLSLSLTTPIFALNEAAVFFLLNNDDNLIENENDFHRTFESLAFLGGLFTIPVCYISVIIGYFFDLSFKQGIITLLATEILLITIIIFAIYTEKRNDSKKKNKNTENDKTGK